MTTKSEGGRDLLDEEFEDADRDPFFRPRGGSPIPEDERGLLHWLRVSTVSGLLIATFGVTYFTLSHYEGTRIANCLMLGMAVAVVCAYLPALWRKGVSTSGRLLAMGILCTWTAAGERRIIDIFNWDAIQAPLIAGDSGGWLSFLSQQVLFLATLAGMFHLAAPGAIKGQIPDRNWLYIGVALGIGLTTWALTRTQGV